MKRAEPKEPTELAYFAMYAGDWLSSTTVSLMTAAEEGTYTRLLCHAWRNDGLPADPNAVRLLTKLSPSEFKRAWPTIESAFPLDPNDASKRRNKRQEKERATGLKKHAKRVNSGKKGAETRWQTDSNAIGNGIAMPSETDSNAIDLPLAKRWQSESESESEKKDLPAEDPKKSRAAAAADTAVAAQSRHVVTPSADAFYERRATELRQCMPLHVQHAFAAMLAKHHLPLALLSEVHMCLIGERHLAGRQTGNRVEPEHVIAAVWEYALNEDRFHAKLFEGYCKRCADGEFSADVSTPDARAQQKIEADAIKYAPQHVAPLPEHAGKSREQIADEARAALAQFKQQFRTPGDQAA